MKRLLIIALLVLPVLCRAAFDDLVLGQAASSKIIEVALRDSTTGQLKTGIAYGSVTYSFIREGDNANRETGTCVEATKDSYTDHGWVETDIAGIYQFGVPQAALAGGKNAVTIKLSASGVIDVAKRVLIMGQDYRCASLAATATLAASQPDYPPAKAGDAMTLTPAYDKAKNAAQPNDAMRVTTGTASGQMLLTDGKVQADASISTAGLALSGEAAAALVAYGAAKDSDIPTTTAIAAAVPSVAAIWAGAVDGTVSAAVALKRLLAAVYNSASVTGTGNKTITIFASDNATTVGTQLIYSSGAGRTTTSE